MFGFSPAFVTEYIAMLEQQLLQRKEDVRKLEHTVHMLEFDKEDLEQKLHIATRYSYIECRDRFPIEKSAPVFFSLFQSFVLPGPLIGTSMSQQKQAGQQQSFRR